NTEEVSIGELAERVRAKTGSRSPIVRIPYDEAYEAGFEDMPRRVPSIEKIHALIGYRPTVGLDEILERVIASVRADVAVADRREAAGGHHAARTTRSRAAARQQREDGPAAHAGDRARPGS